MTTAAAQAHPRSSTGSVLNGIAKWLENHGLKGAVAAAVSAETARQLANPPLATARIDARVTDELLAALAAQQGLDTVRKLGFELFRDALLPVLRPLVDGFVAIHGRTPDAILSKMQNLAGPLTAGSVFAFEKSAPGAGRLTLTYDAPVPAPTFAVWEGGVRALCEACGTPIRMEPGGLTNGGCTSVMNVSWA